MKKYENDAQRNLLSRQIEEEKLNAHKNTSRLAITESDTINLLHELDVHQIELEMQNKELQGARKQAQESSEKFAAIYDFAYTGYFTLNSDCKIKELNLSGANMLGIERSLLMNKFFLQFVTLDTLTEFKEFFRKIFISREKETVEVRLKVKSHISIYAHVEGIISEDAKKCFITIVDISKRKAAEEALKLKSEQLEQFGYLLTYNETQIIQLKKEINLLLNKMGEKEKFEINESQT